MLHLFLMMSILTVTKGDMTCMYLKYDVCYKQNNETSLNVYCIDAPRKARCLQDKAAQCKVEKERVVQEFIGAYLEVCEKGTHPNQVYNEHMECGFNAFLKTMSNHSCFSDISFYSESEDDLREHFRAFCRSKDRTNGCIRDRIVEACGNESSYFHCKVFGPGDKLEDEACIEIGAIHHGVDRNCEYNGANARFGNLFSMMLFQLATVVFYKRLWNV